MVSFRSPKLPLKPAFRRLVSEYIFLADPLLSWISLYTRVRPVSTWVWSAKAFHAVFCMGVMGVIMWRGVVMRFPVGVV